MINKVGYVATCRDMVIGIKLGESNLVCAREDYRGLFHIGGWHKAIERLKEAKKTVTRTQFTIEMLVLQPGSFLVD